MDGLLVPTYTSIGSRNQISVWEPRLSYSNVLTII